MADGTEKPIAAVEVGDLVLATDPETGETASRPVTALIRHGGEHRMVDLTFDDDSELTATDHHPFWNASTRSFVDAIDLKVGEQVLSSGGRTLTVTASHSYTDTLMAYNLEVEGIHTYYAGETPVLVHNSCVSQGGVYTLRNEAGDVMRTGRTGDLAAREVAHHNDPLLREFTFKTEYETNIRSEQRGLEQMLFNHYPEAMSANGGFNAIRGIALANPRRFEYMQAAHEYLVGMGVR